MLKFKAQNKFKIKISNTKTDYFVIWNLCFVLILNFVLCHFNLL